MISFPFCRAAIRSATDTGAGVVLLVYASMMMRSIGERIVLLNFRSHFLEDVDIQLANAITAPFPRNISEVNPPGGR